MADFLDFLPLTTETVDTIRARLDADANAGLTVNDADYLDVTQGGFYWDMTQAPNLEIERLWDFLGTEVPAAMFVAFAWGTYLDYHGETLGLTRKAATLASGSVTFTGTNGTVVPAGTTVSTQAATADGEPLAFTTDASVTVASGTATVSATAVELGAASNVLVGQVVQVATEVSGITGVTNLAPFTGGTDVETDEDFRSRLLLEYGTTQGGGTLADYEKWALSVSGVSYVTVEPTTMPDGTTAGGYVRLTVAGPSRQPVSEATRVALQDLLDPPSSVTTTTGSQTLPLATVNVASTSSFASSGTVRILGNTITYTGKTGTTFTGCSGGSGTIAAGTRVAQGFTSANGLAPIGHDVTVLTVSTSTVTISADLTFLTGYSYDGTGGTIALQNSILAALDDYFNTLGPGDDVVLQHVNAQFFKVQGVYNLAPSSTLLNGVNADASIAAGVLAQRGAVTIT
jgi:uncharacterized phage protein gp47/JayE